MNADEILRCAECSGEARIVRVNDRLLALGHIENPRQHSHPVQLARSGENGSSATLRRAEISVPSPVRSRRSGVPDRPRPSRQPVGPGASHPQRTTGTRPASDGSPRTASPPRHSSPAGRRVEPRTPRPGSASARRARAL